MTDKEKLIKIKKLADAMYYAAQYLTTNASQLHKAMDGYHKFIIHECKEEPVSEDLKEVANKYGKDTFVNECMENGVCNNYDLADAFKAGAKWQKEQFEKNRLAHCDAQTEKEAEIERDFVMSIIENEHRQPTFDDAIKYGMRFHKKQMTIEAIDVEVKVDAGGYPYIPQVELYDYDKDIPLAKEGDKYKVVLIKEE